MPSPCLGGCSSNCTTRAWFTAGSKSCPSPLPATPPCPTLSPTRTTRLVPSDAVEEVYKLPQPRLHASISVLQDVQDPSVIVNFPLLENEEVALIAWTTTPWTLPSNLALCVNPEMLYVKVKGEKQTLQPVAMCILIMNRPACRMCRFLQADIPRREDILFNNHSLI